MKLDRGEGRVREREEEHRDAQVPAVVEQRQEAPVEPAQRPDAEDPLQQQQGGRAEGADQQRLDRRVRPQREAESDEEREVAADAGGERHVVAALLRIPEHGLVGVRHAYPASGSAALSTSRAWPRL